MTPTLSYRTAYVYILHGGSPVASAIPVKSPTGPSSCWVAPLTYKANAALMHKVLIVLVTVGTFSPTLHVPLALKGLQQPN